MPWPAQSGKCLHCINLLGLPRLFRVSGTKRTLRRPETARYTLQSQKTFGAQEHSERGCESQRGRAFATHDGQQDASPIEKGQPTTVFVEVSGLE